MFKNSKKLFPKNFLSFEGSKFFRITFLLTQLVGHYRFFLQLVQPNAASATPPLMDSKDLITSKSLDASFFALNEFNAPFKIEFFILKKFELTQ